MGKAKRLKAQRRDQVRAADGAPLISREPVEELLAAVGYVAELFGKTPNCAAAAALLSEIAQNLDQELTPQPVSVIAHDRRGDQWAFMGPKASAAAGEEAVAKMENLRPEGRDTGHIVVASDRFSMVLDPNMRQLNSYGISAPAVVITNTTASPESGRWDFQWKDLDLRYLLDRENQSLLPAYERARRDFAQKATSIAADIRAGRPVEQVLARSRNS